jgi:hypothetical protein
MGKIMFLVKALNDESYSGFRNRVFESLHDVVNIEKPQAIKLVITEFSPPGISVIPFRNQKIASVSIWQDSAEFSGILGEIPGLSGIYSVSEALPVSYQKNWRDGEHTPGVCLFTLFNRKIGISYETFIDRWHNSHTPLSLRLHPLWNYSRNVVIEKLTRSSSGWDGIVEEHFRTKADLLNPFKFFGNPLTIVPNMLEVYRDTRSFLDYGTIETYLATEYHIVSSNL